MLANVSETAVEEADLAKGHKYPLAFDAKPAADLTDLDLFTEGQPFDAFAKMRETAPVCWHDEEMGAGFWALTGYKDIRATELNTKVFSSQKGGILMNYGAEGARHPLLHRASLDAMICLDQPFHMSLRREHMPFFTPGYVANLRERVDMKVASLLDGMEAKAKETGGPLDMVEMFSAELPLFTLCEILGVEEVDRPKLVKWMHYLERAGDTMRQGDALDPELFGAFVQNVLEMFEYGKAVLQARRKEPRDDLLTAIANAEVDGAKLSDEMLDGSWLLIVFAGNDTTRNSLSGTMKLLTEFPEQKQKLVDDPSLITNMTHEAIRMVSPVIYMRRTATEDAEIHGQKIAEGEKVVMYYGAANRDPEIFETPDRMDVTRANAKDHLAFGMGPHVCLGQRVANMQLEAAYRQILARFPNAEWTGEIDIAPNNFVHAISKLGVDLGL
ncbi:cytochrome P450 [Henriciella sp.]|uniref:cytochrome P450 n=1 Tax=Henriciella sp. TaxID=1968823 RepID=UPI00263A081D|nr:cytochrome P450 [Henriciella sp.]